MLNELIKEFEDVFEEGGLDEENFLTAIVEFQKALITPNSKFDLYLRGDTTMLNSQEKRGRENY